MNLKDLTSYLVKKPHLTGHLGNSFFNQKRINVVNTNAFFIVEQQTLFNFKVKLQFDPKNIKTAYIVSYDADEFYQKFLLAGNYFLDFPNENYIVI